MISKQTVEMVLKEIASADPFYMPQGRIERWFCSAKGSLAVPFSKGQGYDETKDAFLSILKKAHDGKLPPIIGFPIAHGADRSGIVSLVARRPVIDRVQAYARKQAALMASQAA